LDIYKRGAIFTNMYIEGIRVGSADKEHVSVLFTMIPDLIVGVTYTMSGEIMDIVAATKDTDGYFIEEPIDPD
jgi:hypothetical protein